MDARPAVHAARRASDAALDESPWRAGAPRCILAAERLDVDERRRGEERAGRDDPVRAAKGLTERARSGELGLANLRLLGLLGHEAARLAAGPLPPPLPDPAAQAMWCAACGELSRLDAGRLAARLAIAYAHVAAWQDPLAGRIERALMRWLEKPTAPAERRLRELVRLHEDSREDPVNPEVGELRAVLAEGARVIAGPGTPGAIQGSTRLLIEHCGRTLGQALDEAERFLVPQLLGQRPPSEEEARAERERGVERALLRLEAAHLDEPRLLEVAGRAARWALQRLDPGGRLATVFDGGPRVGSEWGGWRQLRDLLEAELPHAQRFAGKVLDALDATGKHESAQGRRHELATLLALVEDRLGDGVWACVPALAPPPAPGGAQVVDVTDDHVELAAYAFHAPSHRRSVKKGRRPPLYEEDPVDWSAGLCALARRWPPELARQATGRAALTMARIVVRSADARHAALAGDLPARLLVAARTALVEGPAPARAAAAALLRPDLLSVPEPGRRLRACALLALQQALAGGTDPAGLKTIAGALLDSVGGEGRASAWLALKDELAEALVPWALGRGDPLG